MHRPAVDVVVPFAGGDPERRAVLATMGRLELRSGDTLTVVDNTARGPVERDPAVVHAPGVPTSYYARNVGAARGAAEWIVFLDADVVAVPDLLDLYFDAPVEDDVGVLGGGIADEPGGSTLAARHAARRGPMAETVTAARDRWAYAQTANAAFRRSAFEEAGGFSERARSGGDADLCFRLGEMGWRLAHRPAARVVHRNRPTVGALLRQKARHGAGAAWLNRRHPGSMPPRSPLGLTRDALVRAVRARDREDAALALVDAGLEWAFAVGRLLPNERSARG